MRAWMCGLLIACGGPSLGSPFVVLDLRVIAMVAEPAQVHAGETTRVTAYLFDPDNNGRNVHVRFYQCDTLGGSAGTSDCAFDGTPSTTLVEVDATQIGTDYFAASFDYTPPADDLSNKGALPKRYGFDEVVLARGDNGLRKIDGSKRITFLPQMVVTNANPKITGFTMERGIEPIGTDLDNDTVIRNTVYTVTPVVDPADAETYSILDYTGTLQTLTEQLSYSWSCSPDCTISQRISYVGDLVEVTTPETGAESGRFSLQVVVRDGRGGEAVHVRTFALLPQTRVNQ